MEKSIKSLKISATWLDYILLLGSLIIIWGAIIYYFYALNTLGIILTLVMTFFSFFWTRNIFLKKEEENQDGDGTVKKPKKLINLILIFGYLVLLTAAFYRFYSAISDRALISPWQVINHDFFWIYALSSLVLSLLLTRAEIKNSLKIFLLSAHYFLSFSAAAIIYKIGYGFDPFIHQATMEIIAAKGLILPKTPYYLGEYSLIIVLTKISGLTIQILNRFLVPLLAALFLPSALFSFLKRYSKSTAAIFLTILFLLILGFSPFIATTPQNLSYLFLILAVLSAASQDNFGRVLILSLAAAAIHPLAGLPAIALAVLVALDQYGDKIKIGGKKIIKAIIWLFAAFSIPLALFISSGADLRSSGRIKLFLASITNLFGTPSSAGREDIVSNFIYLLANNFHLIIILLIIASLWITSRPKNISDNFKIANRRLVFLSSALFIAYLLSGQIVFDNVINYEQSGFANRIPVAIMIFLLPAIALTLKNLISRIWEEKIAIRLIWLTLGISLLAVSLYISYPRFDKYFNSRGYSTSANDIAAVESINMEARAPYIALANQQVSAAALRSFGFDHYYQTGAGELYFYPIPTGSPLYQYYLEMVYKNPGRSSMLNALDLTGVNTGYLVINKYWYQSGRVINEAKLAADKWWTINNEVYIFKYQR